MSPIRIVIIAILIYIAYLIFTSGRKKKKEESTRRVETENSGVTTDELVEDPVCHSLVPKQQAVHYQHQNEILYFCSDECCRKFIEDKKEE